MNRSFLVLAMLMVSATILVDADPSFCDEKDTSSSEIKPNWPDARRTVERGLIFLEQDAAKWRKEHECATCHHGTLTIWAYSEAKSRGYTIDPTVMKETFDWAKARWMERVDLPRDTRPGWKMVNTPAIYFALLTKCVKDQQAILPDELKRIEGHLLRHQEADGSWAWSSAPPGNRPPPFFESDEVATRLTIMALTRPNSGNTEEDKAVLDSRQKALAWLAKTEPADTTQATAVRLMMSVITSGSKEAIDAGVSELLKRQNKDGGWGQLNDLPSDAYATGQSLYALNLAGVDSERDEIRRAVAFLVANQNADGSWPMKSRAHPGAEPYKNPIPITYFGSAWATLGLLRCIPGETGNGP